MSSDHLDRIAEAERLLAIRQQRVSRPGATQEDEISYQQARVQLALSERDSERHKNRALAAEIRALRRELAKCGGNTPDKGKKRLSAREEAEKLFSGLKGQGS